ncbi:TorD/DmsD family molecular chaperone [Arabiibacter massiliensis]|uniref:TorD/DmsD family molecular chaperone n=1 Tax=Arabiibacter massiliensis TaxID=1870985 RepID=UPI0009BA4E02|nr:molecular chaperone TorD family protein [Arabiibacter massiliensis]
MSNATTAAALAPDTLAQLCEVLEDRAEFYLTLAGFYYKPLTQDQIDHMAAQDYSQYAAHADESLLDEGFDDIRRALRKRHTGTRCILATEWTSTFGGAEAYKGRYCVPNASLFLDKSGLTYGRPRNEVSRIFAGQRLRLHDDAGMPESHLCFELEFLSVLSGEIAAHLRAGELEAALEKIDVSQEFIQGHILTWFPQLSELALLMLKTRFYKGVLKITQGYLELDVQTLADVEAEVRFGVQAA